MQRLMVIAGELHDTSKLPMTNAMYPRTRRHSASEGTNAEMRKWERQGEVFKQGHNIAMDYVFLVGVKYD